MDEQKFEQAAAAIAADDDLNSPIGSQPGETPDTVVDGGREWGLLLFGIAQAAAMAFPKLQAVYSEQNCANWGNCMNSVAEKYGWNSPVNSPEIALLTCSLGLAVPTYMIVSADLEAMRAAKAKDITQPPSHEQSQQPSPN